ncbi:LPS assembly lipoprotein LptE [Halomonadaceae bacterium KBTZ08]
MAQAAWKSLLTVALATVLSACGFQLRGTAMVPQALAPLALSCNQEVPEPVCSGVRDRLDLYQVRATNEQSPAYHLTLSGYGEQRRTSALNERAAAAEYELSARTTMELTTQDGIPLLAETEVSASEFYQADEQQVLAGEREQKGMEGLLQQRLIRRITRRLMPFTEQRIRQLRREQARSKDTTE